MSDRTGHMDRPGASLINSGVIFYKGRIRTNCYWHHNPETGKFEVVKMMPAGIPDLVLREFGNLLDLRNWTDEQWSNQGYLG